MVAGISGLQGPPGIKGDRGQDGGKGEPVCNFYLLKFSSVKRLT